MGIFNFKKNKKETEMSLIDLFQFAAPEIPTIKEVRGKDWVYYGLDNLYPNKLNELLNQSAIHNAIVTGKANMMAGNGFLINDSKTKDESDLAYNALPPNVKLLLDNFIENKNGEDDVYDIISKMSKDYQTYGSMALEVVWSMDFSTISTLKYVDTKNIRSGKYENGKICSYWYSRNWSDVKNYIPNEIHSFNTTDKEHYNQLIFIKNGTLDYYGEPFYKGSLTWIDIDAKMANFHLSNIENGFAPSMTLKFYQKPSGPEEQAKIVSSIKKQYSGGSNAGKALIFFSDGKDLAPDVDAINVSNLDKQYLALSDLAVQNILTGGQVTSPALFGIQTPGSLSQGTELQTAYNIYNKSVIAPDRLKLDKLFNKILKINKIDVKLVIAPFNPLD